MQTVLFVTLNRYISVKTLFSLTSQFKTDKRATHVDTIALSCPEYHFFRYYVWTKPILWGKIKGIK